MRRTWRWASIPARDSRPERRRPQSRASRSKGKVRRDGRIVAVPLAAYKTRRIDFGDGEKLAMTIPWGDISMAYGTTGIPNIEVYIPGSPAMVARARQANYLKWFLGAGVVQNFMKRRIERTVEGPSAAKRDAQSTFVWGEVTNARRQRTARIKTANGYNFTPIFSRVFYVAIYRPMHRTAPLSVNSNFTLVFSPLLILVFLLQ